MGRDDATSNDRSLLAWLVRLDLALVRFEAAWHAGESPRIEAYLEGAEEPERSLLLRELMELEMELDRGAGRPPDPVDYRRRFPGDSTLVDQVFDVQQSGHPRDPEDGLEVLGDFELVRELGRGGMGIVYEARQLSLGGRRVAVKILSAAAALDPRQMRRFQVEVQAAACLDHQHIVPVYSVGHERGVPFYVMRLIKGRSLAQLIRELRRGEVHEAADEETGDWIGPDAVATTLAIEFASGRLTPDGAGLGEGKSIACGMVQTTRAETKPLISREFDA